MSKRFPPNMGLDANKPLLYNPYQQELLKARRMRFAPCCQKIGFCGSDGLFRCPACGKECTAAALRVYRRFGAFAGRRGGKSVVGAHAAREEVLLPGGYGWICGPTYEILHDATMPTFLRLLPEAWCENWDAEHLELTLVNKHKIAFRSLQDPDRAHAGVGLDWAWLDEAAFIAATAWDFLRPALTDKAGAAYFTSSVDGYDWTYDRIEKPALIDHKPGFWAAKWRTIDNPFMATFRVAEIEEARQTMTPQIFRQEYEGERENFTGSVYGEWIDEAWLPNDDAIREYIEEWPDIDPSRRALIGLDSGADHPFGAVEVIVTDKGLIVVREYLERQRAFALHLGGIRSGFRLDREVMWSANRNEAQLRLEFAAHDILVAPVDNDQMAGIQRVLSWLYTRQLKIAYTCPKTFDQMKKLRFADNSTPDKQKKDKEKVFKLYDELPDCVRYIVMGWPTLPKAFTPQAGRDLRLLDPRTRWELERMKRLDAKSTERDLEPAAKDFPLGDFYGHSDDEGGTFNEFYG